jgi:hypothetical protein
MRLESDTQDIFFPDPGTHDAVECGVCGAQMDVKRDLDGPTSWVMAMGHSKRKHDTFMCPHRNEPWHKQVIALREFKERCPSAYLSNLVDREIDFVLGTKTPTKQWGGSL